MPDRVTGSLYTDRFVIVGTLRERCSTLAYLAQDRETGQRVVIREVSFDLLSAGGRMRLEYETAALKQVSSPFYARPLVQGVLDGKIYVVYPWIKGVALAERLKTSPLSPLEAISLARDVLSALVEIHQAGHVHRDIRPSSVILDRARDFSKSVLAGCGPICISEACHSDERVARDFARFSSPELSGAMDWDVSGRSDLYSLGVLLFTALTGHAPFEADTVSEILFQHMTAAVADMQVSEGSLPSVLHELVQRLLKKDPRDRYQSAEAVLFDLQRLDESMRKGIAEPEFTIGIHDSRCTLTEPAFVGRNEQLSQLTSELQETANGQKRLALIESSSGVGKTRMTLEIERLAASRGFWVLRGQVFNQVGQEPIAPLLQIATVCVNAFRNNEALRSRLRQRLEPYRSEILTSLPQFATELGWQETMLGGPAEFGSTRIAEALATLLESLGDADRPAVIVLDDCQWLDEQTLKVVQRWKGGQQGHVLLIVTTRIGEGIADQLLSQLRPTAHLELRPLDRDGTRDLIESMAGPLPSEAAETVWRMSEGNPFMASAVLRGLVETKALTATSGGWSIDSSTLDGLQSSDQAGQILAQRIELLPRDAVKLLTLGALCGKEFDTESVITLSDLVPEKALDALRRARENHLIWGRPSGTSSLFVHDKIRETVIARLSPAERRGVHHRIAQYLQQHQPQRVFDLAYHFDAAGQSDLALPYAVQSGVQALASFALETAEQQFQIAMRSIDRLDDRNRHTVIVGLGETLMLRGDYDGARPLLQQAEETASDAITRAEVRMMLGELAFKCGDKETATNTFEVALRQLGCRVPDRWWQLLRQVAREVMVQIAHSLLPRWFVGTQPNLPSKRDLLSWRLYSRVAHGYWYVRGTTNVLWAHLRGLNLAERYRPTAELAQAYSEHAPAMSLIPWHQRGLEYTRRSLQIRKDLNDVWGQGQSLNFKSILLYSASRFEECIEEAQQAVRILERTGDFWEVHMARYQIAASHYRLGNLKSAVDAARAIHQSGLELGDEQASGIVLDVWSRAGLGQIEPEMLQQELQRERHDCQGIAQVLLAEGIRLLGAEQFNQAEEFFTKAIGLAQTAGVVNTYISPNYAWLATTLRLHLENQPPRTHRQRRKSLQRLFRAASQSVKIARRFKNDLPHALRELAACHARRGNIAKAQRLFAESLSVAERQGAQYEQAQTRLMQAQIAEELGRPNADQQLEAAQLHIRAFHQQVAPTALDASLSLIDRFDVLLDAGRRIAAAVSPEAVFQECTHWGKRLLRSERATVVGVTGTAFAREFTQLDDQPCRYDQQLVIDALEAGRTVVASREEIVDEENSVGHHGAFLCSPILVRGEAVGCLYVANTQVQGIFADDEQRIADFITSTAGVALENADGYRKLEDLNQNLGQLVKRRTRVVEARSRELEETASDLRQTKEKLEHAKELAESASLAKSDFLARMSHEIRTPIGAVLGFTELLLNGLDDDHEERQQHLQRIHSNGNHLLTLINDLLDLSKIEADKLETERIPCCLYSLLTEVVESFSSRALEKGIALRLRWDSLIPEKAITDPTRLRQILTNLIGNAVKFTDYGSVTVVVCIDGDLESAKADISVIDTGIGLSPENIKTVFNPFTQADTSVTRRFGGTGLGLSISKRLASALGGEITVQSELNLGSTFAVTVDIGSLSDVVMLKEEDARKSAVSHHVGNWKHHRLDRRRVLIVDDAEANRELISLVLRKAGASVEGAENGKQAVERVLSQSGLAFDVVLMDMQMPVLDGYAAAQQIRCQRPDLPIIALTANNMEGDDEKCFAAGCSDFLAKPIDFELLFQKIQAQTGYDVLEAPPQSAVDVPEHPTVEIADGPQKPTLDASEDEALETAAFDEIDCEILEIGRNFVDKVQRRLPLLRDACQSGNSVTVEEISHWLKGSGGTVGLPRLTELAIQLRSAVSEQRDQDVRPILVDIQRYCQQVKPILDEIIQSRHVAC